MQQWLKEVARGKRGSKDLDYQQTKEVAQTIISGKATDAQIAAYLIALRLKTESPEELLAFVHAYQDVSNKLERSNRSIIDLASPYNGRNSFTGSIPTAILMSEYGLPVFLHGSDSLPPKYGTAIKEILLQLGLNVSQTPQGLTKTIGEAGIAFANTEEYCHSLGMLRGIRKELGVRTLFNTVEKLLNLANAESLMMGAYHRTAINKIAPIFKGLSYKNVYVVQGMEGSEDLPVHRNSFIFKITDNEIESFIVKPEEYGLLVPELDKDVKLAAQEQSEITQAILSGEQSKSLQPYYNQVLFNTGIRYYLFGAVKDIGEGIEIAKQQLMEQRGLSQLEKWKRSQDKYIIS
ncbi:anthranilate phosphoribosyltransferase [Neobacillus niacini]|jgi:anthranilate phosphoribosyltransferase|uniref:anthranilate phosphoribosyltransferase n=1 Tax=Neobacillus niacini TaxID=86668 RepID=UPI00278A906D|nr:anthranilate phosphoribosyltransferase [Neobacillus niacini]MDQ1003108.1 anthranilate phosphoribosyltransferase [Neobacillus niacini]